MTWQCEACGCTSSDSVSRCTRCGQARDGGPRVEGTGAIALLPQTPIRFDDGLTFRQRVILALSSNWSAAAACGNTRDQAQLIVELADEVVAAEAALLEERNGGGS